MMSYLNKVIGRAVIQHPRCRFATVIVPVNYFIKGMYMSRD